jgi:hypothetical protein
MDAERQSVESWISGGTLIAFLTVSAYLWTLAHEFGFCDYFDIPADFISFSPANILTISGTYIFAGALVILFIFISLIILTPVIRFSSRSITGTVISLNVLLLLFFAILLLFALDRWKEWIWIGALLILAVLIFL